MRHERYRQWLPLSLYGELGEEEEEMLEAHLAECDECSREQTELRRLQRVLDSQLAEPPAELLEQARWQLHGALLSGAGIPARDSRIARLKVPLALAASLLIGLVLGQWRSGGQTPPPALLEEGAALANIEFLDDDESDGELVVRFDAVRSVRLSAPPSDPRMQSVLLEALRAADNPGIRIRAVSAVQSRTRPAADRQLRDVLLGVLRSDDNAGVRRRALSVLQEMAPDPAIRAALIEVLIHDENPGLRVAAVNALQAYGRTAGAVDEETLRRLEQRLTREDNDFIRLRSEAWLEEVRFQ